MSRRISLSVPILFLTVSIAPVLLAQSSGKPKDSGIENIGKRDINKGQPNFTSLAEETRLGEQAASQLERNVTLLDDAEIHGYVDRIAQNIAKNSDSKLPITIKVIQSDEVNASALPGGFIYINTGTIKVADNEAELAFVIAHLVGHVAARHVTESNTKVTLFQIGAIPAITLAGGTIENATLQQSQIALPTTMFRFSRAAVMEADFLGLQYLYKAGYDPQAAMGLLRKLEALEASRPKQNSLFATHPPAADRIKSLENEIKTVLPVRANQLTNSIEFDAIKAQIK